jgi:hypothetical protein
VVRYWSNKSMGSWVSDCSSSSPGFYPDLAATLTFPVKMR